MEGAKDAGKSLLKGLTGQGGDAGSTQEEAPQPADALKKLFGD